MLQVQTKTLSGAQITVKTLQNLGVDSIFGYPGSSVLEVYKELSLQNKISHYLVRHEQAAIHAAEGYAIASGKPGIVLVTSGPGATNIITGIANAYFDATPLVVITGQVSRDKLGKNAFQEINILDITKNCSKAGFQVTDANEIEHTLTKAFEIAQSGKKGPVILDITSNVFSQFAEYKNKSLTLTASPTLSCKDVIQAEFLIKNSNRPLVVVGHGVINSNAQEKLKELSLSLNIPIVSTMMGLGKYPNFMGMIGMYGDKCANELIRKADLLLVLGARLNDRITSCFTSSELSKKIIQVDINRSEIACNIPITLGINSDILNFLEKININQVFSNWLIECKRLTPLKNVQQYKSNLLHSFDVIKEIYKYTNIIATEVGQHQITTVKNYDNNTKLIMSGGFGTMGFGFPAAMGASIALKTPITCIAGDGSFQMSLPELATCKDYNLPIKIMIMNNGYLGMVRQLQEDNWTTNYYATKISNPDFIKLAESYGIQAMRVSKLEDVRKALDKAYSTDTPFLIDFVIEPCEKV